MKLMSDSPLPTTDPTSAQPIDNDPDVQTVRDAMPGKYLVKVVRSKCIGAGPCTAVAPNVFQLDGENKAVVITQDELDEMKLLAAQSCPVAAIIVEDIETGEQVWPKE